MKSVSTIIYEFLQEHQGEWHAGYEFVNCYVSAGGKSYFCGSSSDRKARLMAERGVIERKHEQGYAFYRVKPQEKAIPKLEAKQLSFGSTKAYNVTT